MNITISEEQKYILDLVSTGKNITINAVAGSGKTSTSLFIAHANRERDILLLTYNAKLKLETRERVLQLGLDNMEVHSYHAFCVKYLYKGGSKDDGILRFLNLPEKKTLIPYNYDMIIVDEAQDMNPIYYKLLLTIIKLQTKMPQLIIVGDKGQSIYQFNKADSRFLTNCSQIFYGEWETAKLSTSYRITKNMSSFINNTVVGAPHIDAVKSGSDVRYLICDVYGPKPLLEIKNWLDAGVTCDEIFVLAPSVRSERSPVRELANKLTELGIAIYVPTSDEEKLDLEIINKKIVFSTFHQVKGLERRCVIVYGYDQGYFEFIDKKGDPNTIPNTLYVAITRAKEHLTILHSEDRDFCSFVRLAALPNYCKMEVSSKFRMGQRKKLERRKMPIVLAVTDLTRYIPVDVISQCMELLSFTTITRDPVPKLDIQYRTRQEGLVEGVGEINGVVVPSYFELKKTGHMSIVKHIENNTMLQMTMIDRKKQNRLLEIINTSSDDDSDNAKKLYAKILLAKDCNYMLRLSTEWVCIKSGFNFKKSQIKKYDWLSLEQLERCVSRLEGVLSSDRLEFEFPLSYEYTFNGNRVNIYGFLDVLENSDNIWELKMTKTLGVEHYIQTAIYVWLAHHNILKPINVKSAKLYNIVNNREYQLEINMTNISKVIDILVKAKLASNAITTDIEFIKECAEINSNI
jgi:hypothetical protein